MNFDPDNWKKLTGDVRKAKITVIKTGFDKVEKSGPPSGMKLNLTRPIEWDEYDESYRRRRW